MTPAPSSFPSRNTAVAACIAICWTLSGCADPGLVQVSPNAYRIVKSDRVRFYRTTAELKSDAVAESNAFAASRGKLAVAIASSEQPLVPGVEFATVKYHFRLIDKTDPQARHMSVSQQPIVLDKAEGPASAASAAIDIAALDDLRERGVITPEEFRQMKARLLAPSEAAPAAQAQAVKP